MRQPSPIPLGRPADTGGAESSANYRQAMQLPLAGITRGLTSAGVVGLSMTQMAAAWLVVAGLVVLLSIADIACRPYATAKRPGNPPVPTATPCGRTKPGPPGPAKAARKCNAFAGTTSVASPVFVL